ncbi:hypothetical protein X975_21559, partial [Stegodyphus mimosarum]
MTARIKFCKEPSILKNASISSSLLQEDLIFLKTCKEGCFFFSS